MHSAGPEVVECLLNGVLERPPGVADAQAERALPAGGGEAVATPSTHSGQTAAPVAAP